VVVVVVVVVTGKKTVKTINKTRIKDKTPYFMEPVVVRGPCSEPHNSPAATAESRNK